MDFGVRYGNPDGKRLHELPTEKGVWFTSDEFTEVAAMHYWYCDPGRWSELTLEDRGKMLAFYRDKNTMTAYEDRVHADRLKKQNKSKQRGKYK